MAKEPKPANAAKNIKKIKSAKPSNAAKSIKKSGK